MQVNKPFKIKIIFKPSHTYILDTFLSYNANGVFKPTSFQWLELNVKPDLPKFIKWIEEDFKPRFEYDPLLWLASVGTCPEELRKYLIPFHKEF